MSCCSSPSDWPCRPALSHPARQAPKFALGPHSEIRPTMTSPSVSVRFALFLVRIGEHAVVYVLAKFQRWLTCGDVVKNRKRFGSHCLDGWWQKKFANLCPAEKLRRVISWSVSVRFPSFLVCVGY